LLVLSVGGVALVEEQRPQVFTQVQNPDTEAAYSPSSFYQGAKSGTQSMKM
jgi:hypothetical protein